MRAQQDSIKKELLKRLALNPKEIEKFWKLWGEDRPHEAVCLDDLVLKYNYNEKAAPLFLKVYDQTIGYAGLKSSDKMANDNEDDLPGEQDGSGDNPPDISVGDYIQWESDGALQFDKPRQVRAIQKHDDVEWVFVKGSETGIPMNEAIFESKGSPAKPGMVPPTLAEEQDEAPVAGSVKAICPLEEGNAALILPKNLSKASYEDLEYWFKGELRKAARKAGIKLDKDGKVVGENAGD